MREITVLNLKKDKKIFSQSAAFYKKGNIKIAEVKNNERAVRKLRKILHKDVVLITKGSEREKAFSNNCIAYNECDYRKVLPLLYEICRQTAFKGGKKIPVEDFFIMASPHIACEIIDRLYRISRLFTVISDEDNNGSLYDGLYFRHGVPIRQMPLFSNKISDNAMILRCNAGPTPTWKNVPVIDMSPFPETNTKPYTDIRKICVKDRFTEDICSMWNGTPGMCFYELSDMYPGPDAYIDINKTADEIFLLDTGAF